MANEQHGAIEVTTFKLKGYTILDFITANAPIDQWLKKQPGFRSRWMYLQSNGYVADVLIWDTEKEGTDSMHRLMSEHADSIIHDMIDQRTVNWTITPLSHRFTR